MFKKVFLLFSLLSLSLFCVGQNQQLIDSLKRSLGKASPEQQFKLLNEIGFQYRLSFPDSTVFYCTKAYQLGEKIQVKKELSKSLSFIGLASAYKGDLETSFEYHNRAIEVALKQHDSIQLAYGYNNLGRLFFDQGDLKRAYSNFSEARRIFDHVGDKAGLAYIYRSLSNLFKSQKDYVNALDMSKRACELRKEIGEPRTTLSALSELGLVYKEIGDSKNALLSFREAETIANHIQDKVSLAEIKLGVAEVLISMDSLVLAEKEIDNATKNLRTTSNSVLLPRVKLLHGQILYRRKKFKDAIVLFEQIIAETTKSKNIAQKMDATFYISKIYEAQGDVQKATIYTNRYLLLKESLENIDLTRQIERLEFRLKIEKKEKENDLLKANENKSTATIQQQRLQNIVLVVVASCVSLLVLFQWLNSRKRRTVSIWLTAKNKEIQHQREEILKQNENLNKRNQQLSDLNNEKDTLMSIVAHDLKSPLNRIKGLLNVIEMEEGSASPKASYLGMIKDSAQSGLDLITDLLDVHEIEENVLPNYSSIDICSFVFQKVSAFKMVAEVKKIDLKLDCSLSISVSTDEDHLGRILDNLISNAIKFSSNSSLVTIVCDANQTHFWISIKDNGPGFSDYDKEQLFKKFKKLSARPTGGESSNGLGLAIVKTLVERLNGEITLVSQQGKGSEFTARFPIA
ncbi:MAG: tetratricopeptide repeat-containing sensor histidine kinase [Chryseolinea sp.]